MSFDNVSAEGSGSMEDPYRGVVSIPAYEFAELYAEVGTEMTIGEGASLIFGGYSGSGLEYSDGVLKGTLSAPGHYTIAFGRAGWETLDWSFELYVVQSQVELGFLSDPSHGTITYIGT